MKSIVIRILVTLVLLAFATGVAIQFIRPASIGHNPPVVREPSWRDPEARALAVRACFDCHSNETAWPWYTKVAPFSWTVARDVAEGRAVLNFSDWGSARGEGAEEMAEVVLEGEMPPAIYLLMHPSAALDAAEVDLLVGELSSLR
jgi:hypothetical protein